MTVDFRKYKVIGGAMTGISTPEFVAALSNAGALGVLATGNLNASTFEKSLCELSKQTSQIFGVNLIGMSPYFDELLEICASYKVKVIILGAAIPRADLVARIKKTGASLMAFANSLATAHSIIRNGVDAIILEGHEAGGHVGPISTNVLIQEILFNIKDFPIFVAGGIGCGRMIKHCIDMGATGCQLGSRFVCAKESPMHANTKKFYISKKAKDTVVVGAIDPIFSVIPVRVIKNAAVRNFYKKQREIITLLENKEVNQHEALLMMEKFWAGSLLRGIIEGDIENGSLMAGQSISFVEKEETIQEIMDHLMFQMCNF